MKVCYVLVHNAAQSSCVWILACPGGWGGWAWHPRGSPTVPFFTAACFKRLGMLTSRHWSIKCADFQKSIGPTLIAMIGWWHLGCLTLQKDRVWTGRRPTLNWIYSRLLVWNKRGKYDLGVKKWPISLSFFPKHYVVTGSSALWSPVELCSTFFWRDSQKFEHLTRTPKVSLCSGCPT